MEATDDRGGPHAPLLSVVVPTRDNARTLAACLAGIAATATAHEVIVVDRESRDATVAIAAAAGATVLRGGDERSAQRNLGARSGRGSLVAFVDSDMVPTAGVLDEAVALIVDGADAVILTEASIGHGYWARVRAAERSCYQGVDDLEACRVFRRPLLDRLGGFDEGLAAFEDWDLTARARAAGAVVARTRRLILHDEGERDLRSYAARASAYGAWAPAYRRKHAVLAARQLSPWHRATVYLRSLDRLASDPLAAAGIVPLKVAEALASRRRARTE